uniref:Uncharacterized protein n=1 Tax=Tanacetum cinerariifolium TaxID=118510 RepID=A0A6L2LJ00_TANCI|nr:hypothetical protein [Tanacetum cinerariifolium]
MDQDRQMLMVEDNVGNQFRPNAMQNVGNQVVLNYENGNVFTAPAEGNGNGINGNMIRCYNCQREDHYANNSILKPRKQDAAYLQKEMQIAQKEEAGIQLTSEEFDFMAAASACEETERDNANCTLENNLQQASTSGTQSDKYPVYDSDGSAENDNHVIFEVSSIEQGGGTVEQHSTTVEETCAYHELLFHNLDAKVEEVKLVNRKMKETNAKLTTELARYKNQEKCFEISQEKYDKLERLKSDFKIREDELLDKQIQLEKKIKELDNILVKTEFSDDTTPSVERKFLNEVSKQKDTTRGTSANTKFAKQSILGKPPSSSRPKLYAVTPLTKSMIFPKVGKTHALSKPVTSNSVLTPTEPKVVKNDNVIFPGIFRINPFKASRVENFMPNKHVNASVRTKPINVLQTHAITKNDVSSISNGFSPKNIESTTRTRRPQPMNNLNNDKVPSKSKSSCLSNKLKKIEENHRSLQSSYYPDHTSYECNYVKLAIRNEKSEVICAICKQCLIIANHDECVLQYVNGMKSRIKNQSFNVSKSANQKKHKANVKKSKKSEFKESLASPSKPRSFLSDSNPQEPTTKGFLLLLHFLAGFQNSDGRIHTNYSNGENQVGSKSFVVTTADTSDKRPQQDSTSFTPTLAITITADGNIDL